METQADIDYLLKTSGEVLKYIKNNQTITIPCICGNNTIPVSDFSSPFNFSKQEITFDIATKDFYSAELALNSIFTYTSFGIIYTFRIASWSDGLTGWITLFTELKGHS